MLPYLTKCTVVICRQRAIIWKVHIFAFGKQRTMNCSESHPSLKDNIKFCRPFHGKLLEVPCQIVARAREIAESAQCGETGERRKKKQVERPFLAPSFPLSLSYFARPRDYL